MLTVVRKHWFIIVTELFASFLMLLLPFFLLAGFLLMPSELVNLDFNLSNQIPLITFCIVLWTILTIMAAFTTWTHYYLDSWIITDRRIILVDQIHFFNRSVSIFRLERLQDIEFSVKGFIPTMLNFGTVQAQTAGAFESNFKTTGLPDPRNLQAMIQKAMDERLSVLNNKSHLTD